jgi:hypothetical protein
VVKIDASQKFSDPTDVTLRGGRITLEGTLSSSRQLAFYRIKFAHRSNLNLSLTGLSDNLDLALYKPNLDRVDRSTENDDSDESIRRLQGPGTYIVRVNRIDGTTDYKLNISVTRDAGRDFSQALSVNSVVGATNLQGSYTIRGFTGISNGDTETENEHPDYYRFNLNSPATVTTRLEGLERNADLRIYNSKRNSIAFSGRGRKISEVITQTLQPGAYYVKVIPRQSGETKYRLKFSFDPVT